MTQHLVNVAGVNEFNLERETTEIEQNRAMTHQNGDTIHQKRAMAYS